MFLAQKPLNPEILKQVFYLHPSYVLQKIRFCQQVQVTVPPKDVRNNEHLYLQICINLVQTETDFKVIKGENHAMLSVSDALILASGTVALEASLYKTPMIISYRGPWLFYLIYLLVRCIKKVSLPNIILNKDVVPELIQGKAKSDLIAYNIEKFLYNEDDREENIANLSQVRDCLSDKYSAYEVAKVITEAIV